MSEPKDPRELLTLLTDKVQQFVTLGGNPYYTAEEVAYILAQIPNPNARLYARVKYAGQLAFANELALSMRIELSSTDEIRYWQVPRQDWILDLSRIALFEDIDPSKCKVCKGIKFKLIGSKIEVCTGCGGSGNTYLSDAKRAELMQIDKSNWSRLWRDRYDFLRAHTIWSWDNMVGRVIQKHRNAHHVCAT